MFSVNEIKCIFQKQIKRVIAIAAMMSVFIVSNFSVSALNKDVEITCDGYTKNIVTIYNNTDRILKQAGINIKGDDLVSRDDSDSVIKIDVKTAYNVDINNKGELIQVNMAQGTVQDALDKVGIQLIESDFVEPSIDTSLEKDISINITQMSKVKIEVDGGIQEAFVPNGKVIDALNYLNLKIDDNDIVNVDLNSNICDGINIKIDRVLYIEDTQLEKIPFKTIQERSNSLAPGQSEIVNPGSEGEKEMVVRKKLVNGQVVETQEISSKVIEEPINQVKRVGYSEPSAHTPAMNYSSSNKMVSHGDGAFVDHQGNTISYSEKLVGSCTAYSASAGAHTSTGRPAQVGNVAVNPRIIPYGSKLYICSADGSFVYGYAIAADTGGALMNGSALVDLFYNTERECINFGRRNLVVYVLN